MTIALAVFAAVAWLWWYRRWKAARFSSAWHRDLVRREWQEPIDRPAFRWDAIAGKWDGWTKREER